jgi:long-chain acyl-CoA synthetase
MRAHGTTGAGAPPVEDVDARRDPAAFVYTGGTTGPSKGAMLSHFNLVSNAMQSAAWCTLEDAGESVMCVLPFFHAYGMTTEMNTGIYRAATLVLVPRFELHMVLKAIQKERPTIFPGVPRLYQQINDAPESAKYDLRSIRACVSGAAPLPRAVAEKFESLTGGNLVEGYGMTEASPVTHANPLVGKRKAGSIGLPIPDTECRIVALDEPDREVTPGEPGELVIRGPQVMLGYHGHPDESAMTVRDGWLHTGDIATIDADGFFAIVDRLKEMIIVSGFNVYPTEIEDALHRYPKIQKVSVVGVPDEKTGEAVKAFVVLRPGETATADEIITFAREQLSGYRVPKQIEFRDSLPETMIGKVLRRVLLEEERAKSEAKPVSPSTPS